MLWFIKHFIQHSQRCSSDDELRWRWNEWIWLVTMALFRLDTTFCFILYFSFSSIKLESSEIFRSDCLIFGLWCTHHCLHPSNISFNLSNIKLHNTVHPCYTSCLCVRYLSAIENTDGCWLVVAMVMSNFFWKKKTRTQRWLKHHHSIGVTRIICAKFEGGEKVLRKQTWCRNIYAVASWYSKSAI